MEPDWKRTAEERLALYRDERNRAALAHGELAVCRGLLDAVGVHTTSTQEGIRLLNNLATCRDRQIDRLCYDLETAQITIRELQKMVDHWRSEADRRTNDY